LAESSENPSPFSRDALCEALRDTLEGVFATMLAKPVCLSTVADGTPSTVHAGSIVANVALRGEQEGTVSLVCHPGAARTLAASLLMADEPSTLDEAEVLDAIGECANMVAGGLKTRVLDPLGTWALGTPDCTLQGAADVVQHGGMLSCDLDGDILSVGLTWSASKLTL